MPIATLETLDVAGVRALLELADQQGWNPGAGDAQAFHRADRHGFLARVVGGRFAAGISVVRQGRDPDGGEHAFLGLYLADPAHRAQGHGLALWHAALAGFDGVSIGLDGVVEQQANYARSGFAFLHRNVRWHGTSANVPVNGAGGPPMRVPRSADRDALVALDAAVGGVARERFIDAWCLHGESDDRHTLLVEAQGVPVGLGTIRRCTGPHKLGPLIAPDAGIARRLVRALIERAGAAEVTVDVPEPNRAGVAMLERLGFSAVFETARMYRGAPPAIDVSRLFGVATLELG